MERRERWDRQRILDLLRSKGMEWRTASSPSGDMAITDCQTCGGKRSLEIDLETGSWSCGSCKAVGGLAQLRTQLGETAIVESISGAARGAGVTSASDVLANPTMEDVRRAVDALWGKGKDASRARIWLQQVRQIPEETLREFQVGLVALRDANWISIPYIVAGEVRNVKLRSLPPAAKAYRRLMGGPADLFGAEAIDGESDVYLVGSELDRMAASAYGIRPVASASLGSGSWPKDWTPKLAGAKRVFLCYPSDAAGDHGATMVAEKLGRLRCRRVRLPKRDFGECLASGVLLETIDACIKNAEAMIEAKIVTVGTVADSILHDSESLVGAPLASDALTRLVAGARLGELWVISGRSGEGKSTWVLDQAYSEAQRGHTGFVCPFEQRPADCVRKWGSQELGKRWHFAAESERRLAIGRLGPLPLYLLDHYGSINPSVFEEALRYAVEELGATRIYLDHLHYMWPIRDAEHEIAEIGSAVETIKGWTSKLNVVTFLVIQPGKVKGRELDIEDLRGAAKLHQTPDVIGIVDRLRKPKKPMARIRIVKCRHEAGTEGVVYQGFDREAQHYFDMSDADINAALGRGGAKKEKQGQAELGLDDGQYEGPRDDGGSAF